MAMSQMTAGTKKLTTFGQALRHERERLGLTYRDLSVRCGADRDTVKSWENDETVPDRLELKKLFGSMSVLRHFVHLLPTQEMQQNAHTDLARAGFDKVPQLFPVVSEVPPPPPSTFGEALRRARIHEGLDQDELAELLRVTGQAVSAWETGKNVPIRDHYEPLCELFPALRNGPQPTLIRDIEKPMPGPKSIQDVSVYAELDAATPPALITEPVSPKEPEVMPPTPPAQITSPLQSIKGRFTPEAPPTVTANDMKFALIRWGRLIHAVKCDPSLSKFTDLLAEASDAGMTLSDVLDALKDP